MRILWVKAGKLLPVDTGGKIRSYNLLRQLAARHEVTLLTYYAGPTDEAYEAEIEKQFPSAVTVRTGAPGEGLPAQGLNYLRKMFSPAPYAVTKFTSPEVQRLLSQWTGERRFDVAVCDFLAASLNFPPELARVSVLFQHNVESVLWQRQARHERNPALHLVYKIEAVKMLRYERRMVDAFRHVIAVSENDRELMSGMTDPARISIVPTGVDVEQYRAAAGHEPAGPLVLFLGSMDWEANVDGVEYFCRDIWPRVLAAVPRARFRVVGRDPHPRVLRHASATVEVTGRVPSVVGHLKEAAVFVVPLRVGGGTRLKIYEAMAAGKAVVSTTIGAEGLDVHDGRDIIIADDAEKFAASVIELLQDDGRRRELERAASELAARYDWKAIAAHFEESLSRAAEQASAAPPLSSLRGARVPN